MKRSDTEAERFECSVNWLNARRGGGVLVGWNAEVDIDLG